ncbi:hypothetical protein E3N88_27873 [Mikania micrantha]|uniref:Uncharacterized protein n=1 Tax=Mikania micrantha TaxID=192012 RepID=A0A5N6N0W6_9ASTR|nr:hypothetical protein E3N88_27873 [Mikania micrantha]
MAELRVLRGTRCLKISEISPDFFAVCETLFGFSSRLMIVKTMSLTLDVQKDLIVSLSQYQKSSSLELYLVNPCGAEQESLIVLLADNPFAGRVAPPMV